MLKIDILALYTIQLRKKIEHVVAQREYHGFTTFGYGSHM